MNSAYSRRGFIGTGVGAFAAQSVAQNNQRDRRPANQTQTRISRADLIYTQPVARSEEGMPVGNGRMGSLVWTTPRRSDSRSIAPTSTRTTATRTASSSATTTIAAAALTVEIEFSEPVFPGSDFHQQLTVYDGALTVEGGGTKTELLAWPDQDVMAIQVIAPKNMLVRAKLRMLRYDSQYFGKQLETFASEHVAAVQTRNHMALSRLASARRSHSTDPGVSRRASTAANPP